MNMADEEPIDAEVVPDEQPPTPSVPAPAPAAEASLSLAVRQGSTELIPAKTAAERVQIATEMATELDNVIRRQGMRTKVGRTKRVAEDGREEWVDKWHVNVEGWQTLALFLGLAVIPHSPAPLRDDHGQVMQADYVVERAFYPRNTPYNDIKAGRAAPERVERAQVTGNLGYTCRVEVFKDGVLIGAGDGRCDRNEEAWRDRDDYALSGMAATRGQSRSIAATARWIVTLAGYSATPAEEYGREKPEDVGGPATPPADAPPFGRPLAEENKQAVFNLMVMLADGHKDAAKAAAAAVKSKCGYMPEGAAHAIKALVDAIAALPRDADGDVMPPDDAPPSNDGPPIDASAVHQDARQRRSGAPPAPPLAQRPREFEGDPNPAGTKDVMDAVDQAVAANATPTLPAGVLRHLEHIPAAVGAWCSCSGAGRPGNPDQCLVHGIPF
jgi:hypothetical protein